MNADICHELVHFARWRQDNTLIARTWAGGLQLQQDQRIRLQGPRHGSMRVFTTTSETRGGGCGTTMRHCVKSTWVCVCVFFECTFFAGFEGARNAIILGSATKDTRILRVDEIPHHLGYMPYEYSDKPPTNWCANGFCRSTVCILCLWLRIKQEGQTAGFGPCFHFPGQPMLEFPVF